MPEPLTPAHCSRCGAELRAGSVDGVCPSCLLEAGLESNAVTQKVVPPATTTEPLARFATGTRIDRYKILEPLGEGGCGVVYLAEQEQPVRRRVALKVIKLGMDTKQVVARFEAERQALALMDHPCIAKVLDGGATPDGRPFFVMELVRGIRISDYCDQNQLPMAERIALFIQVCRAVQHAHQKGILHRDLKPSNILITSQDGRPTPKVIDFGIAKATTDQRLTDKTFFTAFQQFIGTPAYMSPEQADLTTLDIDTRSDIYSLGVLLYELLIGKTPFDANELFKAGLDAMRRTIREKEPLRPSTRLNTMAKEELTTAAKRRRTDAIQLAHALAGDLDWIVMKALEKDRTRRYETANGLGMDLQRYLQNEPVLARPPSAAYRLKKAVLRNKLAFAAAGAVALALVLGIIAASWQAVRATQARAVAVAQRRRADDEAAKQEAINRFLNDMLASADPFTMSAQDRAKGPKVTMLEVVDAAARQVNAGSLKDRPAIEAAICQTLGETYVSLDQRAAAEPLLRKALELNRQIYGELSDPAIGSQRALANVRVAERVKLMREVLAMERRLHGNEHPHVASSLIELADFQSWDVRGRYNPYDLIAGVEDTYREGLALQRKLLPSDSPELIGTFVSMATFLFDYTGKHDEAENLVREALPIQIAARGKRHPETATILILLSRARLIVKDYPEAERFCKEAVTIQREVFNTNHLDLARGLGSLGEVLRQGNKLADSEAALRESLEIQRRTLPGSLDVAWAIRKLAENLVEQKRLADAEVLYREALKFWAGVSSKYGGGEAYQFHLEALVSVLKSQNKLEETEALYREALQRQRKTLGETNVAVPATLCALGDVLLSRGATNDATQAYQQAMDLIPKLETAGNRDAVQNLVASLRSKVSPSNMAVLYEKLLEIEARKPDNPNLFRLALLQDFGDLLGSQNRCDEAATQYLRVLPIRRSQKDEDGLAWTLRNLGGVLINCSRLKEAEQYLRESITICRALHKTDDLWKTAWPASRLAEALDYEGKPSEARQAYGDALTSYRNCNAIDAFGFTDAVHGMVELLMAEGKNTEAQSVLDEVLAQERRAFGERDIRTAATMFALARCFKRDSKPEQAANCCREAEDIIVNSPPEELLHISPFAIAGMVDLGLRERARDTCNRVLVSSGSNAPTGLNKASWLNAVSRALVLAEKTADSDPSLALETAKNAVELAPENCCYPLGIALYRCGDWHCAVAELAKAVTQDQGVCRISDLLFLAMADHRLGETEASRKYYSEAVNWMTEHSPCRKDLVRVRAEAEAILGVEESRPTHTPLSH